jgi:alpha-ketoglutaric semialdehyde dehydrogenase
MNVALLLVDLQQDYLATPGLMPPADALVERATALVRGWRGQGLQVVHLWTTVHPDDDRRLPHWRAAGRWQCVAGTTGHAPPPSLTPASGEPVVHKSGFDGFVGGGLDAALGQAGATRVVVAGLHMHACVRAAITGCLERGLGVTVAEDAVATSDPMHAASTRRWLAERGVHFLPVRTVLAGLEGEGPTALVHRSPRHLATVLFEVPVDGPDAVAAATGKAQAASAHWRQSSVDIRQSVLERFAVRLDQSASDLARMLAVDIGKPVSHGLEEARRAAANVRDVMRRAGSPHTGCPGAGPRVRHQPLGVVAIITPWNNPLAIPAGKIAPALAYGNTVVWKPAPAATRIARTLLALLEDAGVPAGAVELLTGARSTAQQLAAHPHTDAVTFTGSVMAGYDVQDICAARFVPLQAELGGNNAAIVWDDADLPRAATEIAAGVFGFAGQRCTANRRVIVSAPGFDRLWHELRLAASRLVWNDPIDERTDIGPVIDEAKRCELRGQLDGARSDDHVHRVEPLFEDLADAPWRAAGAYAQPALLACDVPTQPLVQEETMGPLLVVQRAHDFEHALSLCNGVRHGLAAALFTERADLQERFLDSARAGILKLNASTAGADVSLPFGGWKASGIGPPEHGEGDRLFYTRMQAVYR